MKIQSVADAVAVLDYLHRRELLCTQCGDRIAEYKNTFHSRCSECRSPHATYSKAEVPSVLERHITDALAEWIHNHKVVLEKPSPADAEKVRAIVSKLGESGSSPFSPGTK